MTPSGLHLLLTYRCTLQCDHCFVWGSPWQSGTMTLRSIRGILRQAGELGTIRSFYFEGGELFLFYAVLLKAVREAAAMGFEVGIVSNGYWATDVEDAVEWLQPFAGLIGDLSISSDLYHWSEKLSSQAANARAAAEQLGIPMGTISIAQPQMKNAESPGEGSSADEIAVMFRGRAVEKLAANAKLQPWESFTECPHENLRNPDRLHVDPFGNLQICQGISLGNVFRMPLKVICETYDPDSHPIAGPLLQGGPAELVRRYDLPHEAGYADACHLCHETCRALRDRFPEILMPDQMYGVVES